MLGGGLPGCRFGEFAANTRQDRGKVCRLSLQHIGVNLTGAARGAFRFSPAPLLAGLRC